MIHARKLFLFLVLLTMIHTTGYSQQRNETVCRLGFDYDISQSRNWGYNQLVITKIYPYSSAELAASTSGSCRETRSSSCSTRRDNQKWS